jgi:hypothetical protein
MNPLGLSFGEQVMKTRRYCDCIVIDQSRAYALKSDNILVGNDLAFTDLIE